MLNINLLPKEIKHTASTDNTKTVAWVIVTAVLVLNMLVFLFLFGYKTVTSSKLTDAQKQTTTLSAKINSHSQTEDQAKLISNQIKNVENLLSGKNYFTKLLGALEAKTQGSIKYTILTVDNTNKITLEAKSNNVDSLANFFASLKAAVIPDKTADEKDNQKAFSEFSLKSLTRADTGDYTLQIEFKLSGNLLKQLAEE